MKIDIVIQPEMLASFEEIALATEIDFKISTDDLQRWTNDITTHGYQVW